MILFSKFERDVRNLRLQSLQVWISGPARASGSCAGGVQLLQHRWVAGPDCACPNLAPMLAPVVPPFSIDGAHMCSPVCSSQLFTQVCTAGLDRELDRLDENTDFDFFPKKMTIWVNTVNWMIIKCGYWNWFYKFMMFFMIPFIQKIAMKQSMK